jgi:DnaJ-domain-containing protein 1
VGGNRIYTTYDETTRKIVINFIDRPSITQTLSNQINFIGIIIGNFLPPNIELVRYIGLIQEINSIVLQEERQEATEYFSAVEHWFNELLNSIHADDPEYAALQTIYANFKALYGTTNLLTDQNEDITTTALESFMSQLRSISSELYNLEHQYLRRILRTRRLSEYQDVIAKVEDFATLLDDITKVCNMLNRHRQDEFRSLLSDFRSKVVEFTHRRDEGLVLENDDRAFELFEELRKEVIRYNVLLNRLREKISKSYQEQLYEEAAQRPLLQKDYYVILGVDKDANQDKIKAAYRHLAVKYHPDLHPDDPLAERHMKDLNEAYEILGNPLKRLSYDRQKGIGAPDKTFKWIASGNTGTAKEIADALKFGRSTIGKDLYVLTRAYLVIRGADGKYRLNPELQGRLDLISEIQTYLDKITKEHRVTKVVTKGLERNQAIQDLRNILSKGGISIVEIDFPTKLRKPTNVLLAGPLAGTFDVKPQHADKPAYEAMRNDVKRVWDLGSTPPEQFQWGMVRDWPGMPPGCSLPINFSQGILGRNVNTPDVAMRFIVVGDRDKGFGDAEWEMPLMATLDTSQKPPPFQGRG